MNLLKCYILNQAPYDLKYIFSTYPDIACKLSLKTRSRSSIFLKRPTHSSPRDRDDIEIWWSPTEADGPRAFCNGDLALPTGFLNRAVILSPLWTIDSISTEAARALRSTSSNKLTTVSGRAPNLSVSSSSIWSSSSWFQNLFHLQYKYGNTFLYIFCMQLV